MPTTTALLGRARGLLLLVAAAVSLAVAGCDNTAGSTDAADAGPSGSSDGAVSAVNASAPAAADRPARPQPRPAAAAASGSGARISFAKTTHDFGEISDTETYATSYPFRNTGRGTLVINSIKAGCGCTVPTLEKREYAPGEEGQIDIVFEPKAMKGSKPKTITVISNDASQPTVVLDFTSSIRPLVTLDSRFLKVGRLQLGEEHRTQFNMYYDDPEMEFTELSVNQPYITARLVEKGIAYAGSRYRAVGELIISADAPWGTLYATRARILVTGRVQMSQVPIDYDYEMYVQGSIFGDLEATSSSRGRQPALSSTLSFGRVPRGIDYDRKVELARVSGTPFTISRVELVGVTMPGMEVEMRALSHDKYEIAVYGNTGTFSGDIRGHVAVHTDVPGEEHIELRLVGTVQ